MSLNFSSYVLSLSTMMVVDATDVAFLNILPSVIDYAEQRIYREIDLLSTVTSNSTSTFTPMQRSFDLPIPTQGPFVTIQEINVLTPVGSTTTNGTRNPLVPATKEFLDFVWGSSTGATAPQLFAMLNQGTILVGPWPDAAYPVEIVGTIRPIPLSNANQTTFLSLYLPDLFLAASMIFASGYQKNFGAQSDDPRMAASWEDQYQKLFASANAEEMRKKWAGPGWGPQSAVAQISDR